MPCPVQGVAGIAMSKRQKALENWLSDQAGIGSFHMQLASGDASFRRYFRVWTGQQTYIAMDAPPEKEDSEPFVRIGRQLGALGLHVPEICAHDLELGFLLLSDLGTTHYLDVLDEDTVERLYGDALGALAVIQCCGPKAGLPLYDRELLLREMSLFPDWLVTRLLGIELSLNAQRAMADVSDVLVRNALEQPQVCVHRDFHSRNLLVSAAPSPGILDFQDAVVGPLTYDLVSLLRDCYVAWPRRRVVEWAMGYHELALQSGILQEAQEALFLRWFDLMGVQRQLKASGIFARLLLRDGKSGYIKDIPRTLGYILDVAPDYPELDWLARLVEEKVLPGINRYLLDRSPNVA
jgi:aminoglycoside/choline kinase family phosphotransferase